MKARSIIFLTLALSLSLGCKKDNNPDLIDISGITETDIDGNIIGDVDQTDWKLNDTWPQIIENLFNQDNPAHLLPTEQSPLQVTVSCYPNPARHGIMYLNFPSNMYSDVRIVDSNLNIYYEHDYQDFSSLALNGSLFKNKQLYRVYYKLYYEDKVYRGHGDFKFI
jgi:hypothetical protein